MEFQTLTVPSELVVMMLEFALQNATDQMLAR
jgi:hypothetical protein